MKMGVIKRLGPNLKLIRSYVHVIPRDLSMNMHVQIWSQSVVKVGPKMELIAESGWI